MEEKKLNGLTDEEVNQKQKEGKSNKVKIVCGKSYLRIIYDNVFSFFNIVLFVIAGLLIFAGKYQSLFFLVILFCNSIIGLYEDIKARRLMDKMRIATDPSAKVIRNGKEIEIPACEIVEGDIVILTLGSKICVDGTILKGNISVNESLLTGEPDDVIKKVGDTVLGGTYVTSGSAYIRADKVGKDSYSNKLSMDAKKFKRSPSVILKSLKNLFRVLGGIVIVIGLSTIIVYAVQGDFSSVESFKNIIGPLSGSLVGMIPAGLYLLTSTALAVAVISLSKKGARVQDFYSVEMLARSTCLCIDKTGTITDGTMSVVKVQTLNILQDREIRHILSDLLRATGDNNSTAQALLKSFNMNPYYKTVSAISFNSKNKYSAVRFDSGESYVLGAPEFINYKKDKNIQKAIEENTANGLRVLLLARNNNEFKNNQICGEFEGICLIILKDNIKPNVKETLEWFKQNGVKIKVISGDNALTVSKISALAGVEDAERYISLEGMSDEEVRKIVNEYNVFGRVTPEQKAIIVDALKEAGEKVAMTGDGVNDILALKKADCSIAMMSGADSARDTSHIVLMDNDFDSLPKVVGEGRRVVNNLQRTCSLFLVKTSFSIVFSLIFIIASIVSNVKYPFITNYMYLWEFASIGLSSFFLALEPNSEMINGKFMKNILKSATPAAITIILSAGVTFILYLMESTGSFYFDIHDLTKAAQLASIVFTIVGMFVLLKVCIPLDKYRKYVFIISVVINIAGLALCIISSLNGLGFPFNFLLIDFTSFSPLNWLTISIISVVAVAIFFFYYAIVKAVKTKMNSKKVKNEN